MATKKGALSQAEKDRLQRRKQREKVRAQKKKVAAKKRELLKKKVGKAQWERHLKALAALDAKVKELQEEYAKLGVRVKKTRQEVVEVLEPEAMRVVATAEENRMAEVMQLYRERLASGEIEAVPTMTDFDLDTSPRGAITSSHASMEGAMLTTENVEGILYRAREALQEAKTWNKNVYAVIHMFQSEPTYEKNTDIGRAGGKPDGWIWEDPQDNSKRIYSTWQGIKATDVDSVMANLEVRLEEVIRANGKKNVALLHEIVFRSVLPTDEQQRQPNRFTLGKVERMRARDEDDQ